MIVGVDPGMTGAFALLDSHGDLVKVEDMPCLDGKVNGTLVMDILYDFLGDGSIDNLLLPSSVVVIEKVQPMPQNGSIGNFKLGLNAGIVQGVVMGEITTLIEVSPSSWKRQMGLAGAGKDGSRAMAMQLWPAQRDLFKRKKDDGRAEAALIARWYWQRGR